MKNYENICKFNTFISNERLETADFVLEHNAPDRKSLEVALNNKIGIVTNGEGLLCEEYTERKLTSGTLFIIRAGTKNCIVSEAGLEYMYITFVGGRADELFARFDIYTSVCCFDGYKQLVPFWQACLSKAGEANLDLLTESVVLYTFSQIAPSGDDGTQKLVSDILKHIQTNFTDSSLSLESTAAALGYNSKYISRVFKKNIGVTFSEYLRNIRIENAVFLIDRGLFVAKNIAVLSGFSDASYFSKVFKATVGISLTEYINRKN